MYNQHLTEIKLAERASTALAIKKHQEQIKTRQYVSKVFYCVLIGLAFYSIHLIFNAPSILPTGKLCLALLILWVCLFPSLYYLKDPQRPPIPFLPLIGLFYAIAYSIPMFFADDVYIYGVTSLSKVTHLSLFLTLIGVSSLICFFYLSKSLVWKNVNPVKISSAYSMKRLLFLTWVGLIAHLIYEYVPILHFIPSIGSILTPLGALCYGIFYFIWTEEKLPRIQALLIAFVFLPLEVLSAVATGFITPIIKLAIFASCILWYKRQRISIILVVCIISSYILLNPVKTQFRRLTWNGAYSSENFISKARLFVDLAIDYNQNKSESSFAENQDDHNLKRIANIAVFSKVIEDTPSIVPYWNGTSYTSLITKFIPRIIWPNKPTETVGNQFGQRYQILSHMDSTTSINLPWLIELYANFGGVGVLLGMSFFGVLLALFEQLFNNHKTNLIESVIGMTVILNLIYQESNFSMTIGLTATLGIGLYFMAKLLLSNKRETRA